MEKKPPLSLPSLESSSWSEAQKAVVIRKWETDRQTHTHTRLVTHAHTRRGLNEYFPCSIEHGRCPQKSGIFWAQNWRKTDLSVLVPAFHDPWVLTNRGGSRISIRGVLFVQTRVKCVQNFETTPTFFETTPIFGPIWRLQQLQICKSQLYAKVSLWIKSQC